MTNTNEKITSVEIPVTTTKEIVIKVPDYKPNIEEAKKYNDICVKTIGIVNKEITCASAGISDQIIAYIKALFEDILKEEDPKFWNYFSGKVIQICPPAYGYYKPYYSFNISAKATKDRKIIINSFYSTSPHYDTKWVFNLTFSSSEVDIKYYEPKEYKEDYLASVITIWNDAKKKLNKWINESIDEYRNRNVSKLENKQQVLNKLKNFEV